MQSFHNFSVSANCKPESYVKRKILLHDTSEHVALASSFRVHAGEKSGNISCGVPCDPNVGSFCGFKCGMRLDTHCITQSSSIVGIFHPCQHEIPSKNTTQSCPTSWGDPRYSYPNTLSSAFAGSGELRIQEVALTCV